MTTEQGEIAARGLSPRLRGNASRPPPAAPCRGSIPALAGERISGVSRCCLWRVYPRACGGTRIVRVITRAVQGLSPRLRGNDVAALGDLLDQGSIPALAGERKRTRDRRIDGRVYPRACGGTRSPCLRPTLVNGLSPRLRGNEFMRVFAFFVFGSIPALAGERFVKAIFRPPSRVYPRACGGTIGSGHWQ